MDLIIGFRLRRRVAPLYVCLLLFLAFFGCSSKDDGERNETNDVSATQESVEDQNVASVEEVTSLPGTQEEEEIGSALARLDSLSDAEERIEAIEELCEMKPGSIVEIVGKAVGDKNPEVRLAAMELLVDYEVSESDLVPVISVALEDKDEEVREAAVYALEYVDDAEAAELLIQALGDSSEDVRIAIFEVAGEKEESIRLEVCRAGINSTYEDVKEEVVDELIDLCNHDAVDILISGLRDPDAEFREEVNMGLEFLIFKEFENYEEAKRWWDAHRYKYDEELSEKEE